MSPSAISNTVIRLHQFILNGSTLLGSWLAMQATHEAGHSLGAWLTGGRVARVVLHPLTISRTDLSHNPHPLLVVWAGPAIGVIAPLIFWMIAACLRMAGTFVLRFFAGFCLIANGAYISFGSLTGIGDCGEMLREGSSIWQLWLFGLVTLPCGMWLWHGQGANFGLGGAEGKVNLQVAYVSLIACLLLLGFGFWIGRE